jgi:hypothetical protein
VRYIVIAALSIVFFFPMYWLFESVVGPDWGAGIAAVAMYIAFPIIALSVWKAKPSLSNVNMADALENGKLGTADFDVHEAIEVEEAEDEGLIFFLDIGNGRTLFLAGQYLYTPCEESRFPSDRIRVYWHTDLDLTYGVESLGDHLLPSDTLPPLDPDVIDQAFNPLDREVIAHDLATVRRILRPSD